VTPTLQVHHRFATVDGHLVDGGHFLLESAGAEVAGLMRDFRARRLALVG
jgi:hypothetical protein